MRFIRAVIAGLAGLALLASPMAMDDDQSGICVGGMEMVACVPPEGT